MELLSILNHWVLVTNLILLVVVPVLGMTRYLQQKRKEKRARQRGLLAQEQAERSASARQRLLADMERWARGLRADMAAVRGPVPGGTARAWSDAMEGLLLFLLMQQGEMRVLADCTSRFGLSDEAIRHLIPRKRGIRWILEAVKNVFSATTSWTR